MVTFFCYFGESSQDIISISLLHFYIFPTETLSEFVIGFSIYTVEVLAGAMSIILHELAQDAKLQEKIRDNDKVKFSLEGLPRINAEFLSESLYIDSIIKGKIPISLFLNYKIFDDCSCHCFEYGPQFARILTKFNEIVQ